MATPIVHYLMMELKHRLFTIRTGRDVWLGVLGLTAIAVFATALPIFVSVYVLSGSARTALATCAQLSIFPLLGTPPLAWFGLRVARLLTQTIDRVDNFVRYDTLTGVLTRAYLLGKFRELGGKGAFLMIDADHFKTINDTYGHDVGDEALKRLANIMRATLAVDALVGRLGGEEFGVYLPGATEREAAGAAEQLCEAIRRNGREVGGVALNLTVSIGGAEHHEGDSIDTTMKLADQALYHAKRTGRDRFYIAAASDTMPALVLRSRVNS